MAIIHFKGVLQETPEQKKNRIQKEFLKSYEEFQLSKQKKESKKFASRTLAKLEALFR